MSGDHTTFHPAWTAVVCCPLVLLAGCGPAGPDVQMVEGTITLDGAPLGGAYVTFIPLAAGGLPAVGLTRDDGRYVLSAFEGRKFGQGTVRAEYAVMVRKMVSDPKGGAEPVLASPELYASEATTPLRAAVVEGRNTLDFDLASKPAKSGGPQ